MLKNLTTILLSFFILSAFGQLDGSERIKVTGKITDDKLKPVSYAHIIQKSRNEGWVGDFYGNFRADLFPGDTLVVSSVSFYHAFVFIPDDEKNHEYYVEVILQQDTVQLKELVVYPWPATYSQLKKDFLKVEVEDPLAELDLHLPSMIDIKNMLKTPMEPGQIGLYSGTSPISILYDQYSKEAKSKRIYAGLMNKDRADKRYNKALVSRITGLKTEDDLKKFMDFCTLQIKFILESTDYELYAAILNCYDSYCKSGFQPDADGE